MQYHTIWKLYIAWTWNNLTEKSFDNIQSNTYHFSNSMPIDIKKKKNRQ